MGRASEKFGDCAMCSREKSLTFHHLIPRTTRTNKWFKKNFERPDFDQGIDICRDCHIFIHKQYAAKHLGRELNSLDKLMADPIIAKFVDWVKKR
ncbi:MAG: hypothetical protein AAGC88_00105 [Bacteroidota bacterium]